MEYRTQPLPTIDLYSHKGDTFERQFGEVEMNIHHHFKTDSPTRSRVSNLKYELLSKMYLKRRLTQQVLAEFFKTFSGMFTDAKIFVLYKDVPKGYSENSGLPPEKLWQYNHLR